MNWLDILSAEAKASSMTRVAERLQISRTAVSLCLAGRYPCSTKHIEAKVLDVLGRLDCLAIGESVTVGECQTFRKKPAPTHNPMAMQAWKACLHCPHNPDCAQRQENQHAQLH